MRFFFDERRAAQAAARLLHRHGGPMPCGTLIKLLYLADREALIETCTPITGDRFVAMPHGPVLGGVLDLIENPDAADHEGWSRYVSPPRSNAVTLAGPPEFETLAPCDERILDSLYDQFGRMNWENLAEYTRNLPEWTDPGGDCVLIDPADILLNAGIPEAEVIELDAEAEAVYLFRTSLEANRMPQEAVP